MKDLLQIQVGINTLVANNEIISKQFRDFEKKVGSGKQLYTNSQYEHHVRRSRLLSLLQTAIDDADKQERYVSGLLADTTSRQDRLSRLIKSMEAAG